MTLFAEYKTDNLNCSKRKIGDCYLGLQGLILVILPQEIIEHDLHIIPVYLDRGLAFFGQADQGAGDTVDKFLLDADITGIF